MDSELIQQQLLSTDMQLESFGMRTVEAVR